MSKIVNKLFNLYSNVHSNEDIKKYPNQEELLLGVFTGVISVNNLPEDLFDYTSGVLIGSFKAGYRPSRSKLEQFVSNLNRFSGGKVFHETLALQQLKSAMGDVPFKEFAKNGNDIASLFNETWLRTEAGAARRIGEGAKQWVGILKNRKEFPLLQYITQRDERVRAQHKDQDFKIYPVDHPFWKTWFPPNGWNCRCFVKQLRGGKASTESIPDNEDPVFGINAGQVGKVFGEGHPYFDVPDAFKKAQKNNFGFGNK